jgi:hypothetical protein
LTSYPKEIIFQTRSSKLSREDGHRDQAKVDLRAPVSESEPQPLRTN